MVKLTANIFIIIYVYDMYVLYYVKFLSHTQALYIFIRIKINISLFTK